MLTQIVYDLQKNSKLKIYTNPTTGSGTATSLSGSSTSGMTKFYPSGTSEEITYQNGKLDTNMPPLPAEEITYIDQLASFPPSQIYSLLNTNVEYKDLIIEIDNIILGSMPNMTSIMWSSTTEYTIGQQFGLVYKDERYQEKYNAVEASLGNEDGYVSRHCVTLDSISKNKSMEDIVVYASGQVLSSMSGYSGGTSDAQVEGIQYISDGYDINYYNQTIVPTKVTSSISSVHYGPVQSNPSETSGAGGYTDKSFTTSITSTNNFNYLYMGTDPLIIDSTTTTTMSSETLVDLENYIVVAFVDKNNQFQRAFIANKKIGGTVIHSVGYDECVHNSYSYKDVDAARFYRLLYTTHARQEDCIIGDLNGDAIMYPCTKGADTWSGLTTLISFMETLAREQMIQAVPMIEHSDAGDYYTKMGGEMKSLTEVIAGEGSLYNITNYINASSSRERLERSTTRIAPMGRNMSYRILYSERMGENTQDFDSKSYTAGPEPFKHEVYPTYPARASAGTGSVAKNVGYGNAVFYDNTDIQMMADNFAAINEQLGTIQITFKGAATLSDLEDIIDPDNCILDKVNWDLARNVTTFTCRAVVFN